MTLPAPSKVRITRHAIDSFQERHPRIFNTVPNPEAYLASLALDPDARVTSPTFRNIDGRLRCEFRVADKNGMTMPVAADVVDGVISNIWTVPTVYRRA